MNGTATLSRNAQFVSYRLFLSRGLDSLAFVLLNVFDPNVMSVSLYVICLPYEVTDPYLYAFDGIKKRMYDSRIFHMMVHN